MEDRSWPAEGWPKDGAWRRITFRVGVDEGRMSSRVEGVADAAGGGV